jgi:hypothetical protein
MEYSEISKRIKVYQITAILSILLTLSGFTYNVYRLEQSEINSNIRTSSFEMLKELASLEQIVYAAYYEQDKVLGNPRTGWVKVGMIKDLSIICFDEKVMESEQLVKTWEENWPSMNTNQNSVEKIITSIDNVRKKIRVVLQNLN